MQPLPIPSGTGFVMADPQSPSVEREIHCADSDADGREHGSGNIGLIDRASEQPSHYRENLANHLGIAIPELISSVDSARIRVNHQTAVLPAAAPAQVGSVTFENDVQRLLP